MNIRTWIIIIINSLVILAVLLLSLGFYTEFSKALDERVMLHLNSIKTLKQIPLEQLINKEWEEFNTGKRFNDSSFTLPNDNYLKPGIYDLTHLNPNKQTSIGLIRIENGQRKVHIIDYKKIKNILLERTGMGASGESYLVGQDLRLRSQSRFFPNEVPYNIEAKTKGVVDGLNGHTRTGIFPDYRGVSVYSAYTPISIDNLNWIILSEIDVEEVTMPLHNFRKKLLLITIGIIITAIIISLFLTNIISNPILEMKQNLGIMSKGNYDLSLPDPEKSTLHPNSPSEIKEMFEALENLKTALSGAVDFSTAIGKMNLAADYQPQSPDDALGYSLLNMRAKLINFRNQEKQLNLVTKRFLVEQLEKERRRLARELHDGIGPLLTSLKLYVQNHIEYPEHKEEMKHLIDNTISEIRLMTNALMPAILDDFGIGPALSNYVKSVQKPASLSIAFEDLTRPEASNIPKELQVNLFRITQELVNNTIKHSRATKIRITLSEFDDFISLYYFDDGGGFDSNVVKLGAGIANIKERVEIFNGTLKMDTADANTIYEIELPLEINTK